MKYRRLGKTGLTVSVVGIGTWQFGGEWGQEFSQREVNEILDRAGELGVNFIDTAECYGDHLSESFIGDYLKRRGRDGWIVATKFGHEFHRPFERTDRYDAESVRVQLEASLKALKTDYVDLYQFHSGSDQAFDNDELWTMLDKQVRAGKIRHLGISLGKSMSMRQVSQASKVGASVIQVVYNRLDRGPEEAVFPSCVEQDLGVLARVPLASGFLSGKYKPGDAFSPADVRSRRDADETERKLREAQRIREEEVPGGMDMAVWALAWCLKHPAVTCVIPGCKSPRQAETNARAAAYITDNHPQAVPDYKK